MEIISNQHVKFKGVIISGLFVLQDIYGVMVGGVLGHSLCTGLAVLGGRFVAQRISVRTGKHLYEIISSFQQIKSNTACYNSWPFRSAKIILKWALKFLFMSKIRIPCQILTCMWCSLPLFKTGGAYCGQGRRVFCRGVGSFGLGRWYPSFLELLRPLLDSIHSCWK